MLLGKYPTMQGIVLPRVKYFAEVMHSLDKKKRRAFSL